MAIDSLNMLFSDMSGLSPAEQQQRVQTLLGQRMDFFFKSREAKLDYVKANLDKELAAYYLLQQGNETIGEFYPQLAENVRIFAHHLRYPRAKKSHGTDTG